VSAAGIGELREGPLHAAVKDLLAVPGDRAEVRVEGFVIDLVRAGGELVEIQTGGFSPLGRKLDALLDGNRMRIVFPVPAERRIIRIDDHGEVLSARRSPLKGSALDVFDRLVSFPSLIAHPNLVVEVLLCKEDHVRAPEAGRSRSGRRRRDPGERRLIEVLDSVTLDSPAACGALLPDALGAGGAGEGGAEGFTTRELAAALGVRMILAQRIAYCLRAMEVLQDAGRRGRAPLHRRA
jgi:hypothetical protein